MVIKKFSDIIFLSQRLKIFNNISYIPENIFLTIELM